MTDWLLTAFASGLVIGGVFGFWRGFRRGIKETELRWHQSIPRKERKPC